jgi:uncharacterized protein YprB with RNaseH-like and TPR domain
MLQNLDLSNLLILDIETVPQYPEFDAVPEAWKPLWAKKTKSIAKEDISPSDIYPRASIYAEFGKIVCISVGFFYRSGNGLQLKIKSFCGHDEVTVLTDFISLLNKHYSSPHHLLCAHNGKEFDFPYLSRRILINGLKLPALLNIAGKKPWEICHLDTMELWKFGDYKNFTSLNLLAHSFGIPTPKDDIDGADVWRVYWQDNDIERIKTYCQKDVLTVAQLLLRFQGEKLLEEQQVLFA